MKWVIAPILALILIGGFLFCRVSSDHIASMEEGLHYSMGLAGEKRLLDLEENEDTTSSLSSFSEEKTLEQEELSSFYRSEGGYIYSHHGESQILASEIKSKIPMEGEVDYRGFAFRDRIPPLIEPLTEEELCYVFAVIVSSATLFVPIKGDLKEISFLKKEQTLYAKACIVLDLRLLKEGGSLSWLPDEAVFDVKMEFLCENSDISVCYEKTKVQCKTFELPEALLVFGCNVAFGEKDYKKLFGDAVQNVFINARIYG